MKPLPFLSLLLFSCLFMQCHTPPSPNPELDALFSESANVPTNTYDAIQLSPNQHSPSSCTLPGAPSVTTLLAQATQGNLNIKALGARVVQARAMAARQGSELWPSVGLLASRSRQLNLSPFTLDVEAQQVTRVSMPVSYELDLWGGRRQTLAAANKEAQAQEFLSAAATLSLGAEISELWIRVVFEVERRTLLQKQQKIAQALAQVLISGNSQDDPIVLAQQKAWRLSLEEESLRSKITTNKALEALRVLLGVDQLPKSLQDTLNTSTLPTSPLLRALDIQTSMTRQRPDVRAALARLQGQSHAEASLLAAQLPSINLQASIEFYTSIEETSRWGSWSAGLQTYWNMFDGGEVQGQMDQAQAKKSERFFAYLQVLALALKETNVALFQYTSLEAIAQKRAERLELLKQTHLMTRDLYQRGQVNILQVYQTLQAFQFAQQNMLSLHQERLSTYIQLCRALGGQEAMKLTPPPKTKAP